MKANVEEWMSDEEEIKLARPDSLISEAGKSSG